MSLGELFVPLELLMSKVEGGTTQQRHNRADESAQPLTDASIGCQIESGVATVVLSNVAQRNALTPLMCRDLIETITRLDEREDVLLILLRGAQGTFCSGVAVAHLREFLLEGAKEGSDHDLLSEVDAVIGQCQTLVIALVEGFCFGGGWQLASACDAIVASDRALFAITPSKLGIIYPRVGLERLTCLVGAATAKYLLATGARFGAQQALIYGLVSEVVPEGEFEKFVADLAQSLLSRSQFSIWATKQIIDAAPVSSRAELDDLWRQLRYEMATGPDAECGIAAFTERRVPEFAWRRKAMTEELQDQVTSSGNDDEDGVGVGRCLN